MTICINFCINGWWLAGIIIYLAVGLFAAIEFYEPDIWIAKWKRVLGWIGVVLCWLPLILFLLGVAAWALLKKKDKQDKE